MFVNDKANTKQTNKKTTTNKYNLQLFLLIFLIHFWTSHTKKSWSYIIIKEIPHELRFFKQTNMSGWEVRERNYSCLFKSIPDSNRCSLSEKVT